MNMYQTDFTESFVQGFFFLLINKFNILKWSFFVDVILCIIIELTIIHVSVSCTQEGLMLT